MSRADFRPYIPEPGTTRIEGRGAKEHGEFQKAEVEIVRTLMAGWHERLKEPFKGITTEGSLIPNLYEFRSEGVPTSDAVRAASALLAQLTPDQKISMCFPVDSDQWRNWQNTEMWLEDHGLRLELVSPELRDVVMAIVAASLSREGYEKSRNVMRLNRFLGDLVRAPDVLGEWSYNFNLFGTPSMTAPWGWQLYGHHLAVHCLVLGDQMVVSPTFFGAEPAYADSGPFEGISLFEDEEREGLALMQSLSAEQQARALVSPNMEGPPLPPGRVQRGDHRHLGGAYFDNRIIPYEGLQGSTLNKPQRQRLLDLTEEYLVSLPDGPRRARMEDVERHLDDTHFCWIGGVEDGKAFYYRIQSPVVLAEFDHHPGVFLTNKEPANFHIHTLVRTPNGNDYGMDLIRMHYQHAPHHRHDD